MDLRLPTLKSVSFYLLHNVSTPNQCRKLSLSQLCVNTLTATKVTLITDGISFASLRVKTPAVKSKSLSNWPQNKLHSASDVCVVLQYYTLQRLDRERKNVRGMSAHKDERVVPGFSPQSCKFSGSGVIRVSPTGRNFRVGNVTAELICIQHSQEGPHNTTPPFDVEKQNSWECSVIFYFLTREVIKVHGPRFQR
jgi:hypothetical protein